MPEEDEGLESDSRARGAVARQHSSEQGPLNSHIVWDQCLFCSAGCAA